MNLLFFSLVSEEAACFLIFARLAVAGCFIFGGYISWLGNNHTNYSLGSPMREMVCTSVTRSIMASTVVHLLMQHPFCFPYSFTDQYPSDHNLFFNNPLSTSPHLLTPFKFSVRDL